MTPFTLPGVTKVTFRLVSFLIFSLLFTLPVAASDGDTVPATPFASPELVKGTPPGWVLDKIAGTPDLCLEKEGEGFALRLASDHNTSFGIKRELRVDLRQYPFLNWRWKASRLPKGGDVRKKKTDDQALQFYIAFPSTGFPAKLNTPVVGYIWDNEAPSGWTGRSDQLGGGKLRYAVVRNKADRLGEWHWEKRNLYQDSRKLLGDLKGVGTVTQGIAFYINSQNTKSEAEGWIADVFFSRN